MIMEADQETGAIRKQYIGIMTMLDVLAHVAGDDDGVEKASDDQRGLERRWPPRFRRSSGIILKGSVSGHLILILGEFDVLLARAFLQVLCYF